MSRGTERRGNQVRVSSEADMWSPAKNTSDSTQGATNEPSARAVSKLRLFPRPQADPHRRRDSICTREPHSSLRCNCHREPRPDAPWGHPTILGEAITRRTEETHRDAHAGVVRVLTLDLAPCARCPGSLAQVVHVVHADPTDAGCALYFRGEVARVRDAAYFDNHDLYAGRPPREVLARDVAAKLEYFVDVFSDCSARRC